KYPFASFFSEKWVKKFLKFYWPIVVSEIEGMKDKDGRSVKGWVLGIPLTADQMVIERKLTKKKILQATKLAEKLGVSIMGLGAMTASLTRGGLDLIKDTNIGITTGRAYTVKTVTDTLFAISKRLNIDLKESKIGIVGAAGGVGSGCFKLLAASDSSNFILIDLDRKLDIVNGFVNEIKHKFKDKTFFIDISSEMSDIRSADIIIAATNSPDVVIKSEDLKSGAVIINDAQPSDISPDIYKNRNDVLILEGGVINTLGINYHFNFGLLNKEDTFCCLGEVMILAYGKHEKHYALGYLDMDLIDDISTLSKNLNFRLAEFQNHIEGKILDEKMEKIKSIIKK
ncbi:MAG: hypothetical protein NUV40_03990, partial [Patescibacteria group bacterium]|nr:hypothetical protein [Patescibacteria group bacterium]